MKRLLIIADWYLPGYSAGGPIKSLSRLVNSLENEFEITLVTRDHDMGNRNEKFHKVSPHKLARVVYVSNYFQLIRLLISEFSRMNILYLNSFFSFFGAILPLMLTRLLSSESLIVLSPRGELLEQRLAHKSKKKKIFLSIFRSLYSKATFIASSREEHDEIKNRFENRTVIIKNLPPEVKVSVFKNNRSGVYWASRIMPYKGLWEALDICETLGLKLNVYGPIEDKAFFERCQHRFNETLLYKGSYKVLPDSFKYFKVFLFPTHGENYGHVIAESLALGNIVISSERIPWNFTSSAYHRNCSTFDDYVSTLKVALNSQGQDAELLEEAKELLSNDDILMKYRSLFERG